MVMIFLGFGEVVVVCGREEGGIGLKKNKEEGGGLIWMVKDVVVKEENQHPTLSPLTPSLFRPVWPY